MTVILLIASAGNTCGHQVSLNVMPTGKEISFKHVFFSNKNDNFLLGRIIYFYIERWEMLKTD